MARATSNIAALRRILQQEVISGNSLIALAEEASASIINGETDKLAPLEQRQRQVLDQQRIQESARISATRDLAWGLKLDRVPPLSELIGVLPPTDASDLAKLRGQLLELHTHLERVNSRNRLLLDNMLAYVHFSLDVLTSAALQPARYGTNLTQVSAPTFYVDSKA